MPEPAPAALAERVLAGDLDAIAAALSRVEDTRTETLADQRAILHALEEQTPAEHGIVGLTGPPGAGKSTLAGALIRHWLEQKCGVGMVAVDPSSRRSGGALLGDRARLRFAPDEPVFVRSMAAREHLGGLAPATRAAAVVLRAAFPFTIVETVGVGQSEVDVATLADSVALVLQPDSGDTLQFMKAGILEIPDLLIVHKQDLGEVAERTRADLEAMLAAGPAPGAWVPPVIPASGRTGAGVVEIAEALARHRRHLDESGELARRREAGRCAWALELFVRRFGSYGLEKLGGEARARELCHSCDGTALDAYDTLTTAMQDRGRS